MFNPPHPGEIIREDCLKPLDLSVTAAAKWLPRPFLRLPPWTAMK
jgi:plasmid maintenance system antidote protein VapI